MNLVVSHWPANPVVLAAVGLGVRHGREQGRAATVPEAAPGWLGLPVALTVAFNVAWCGWHLPVRYDAVGGAVLWVIMLVPYSVAMVALLIGWLNHEESTALATGFDRLLEPAKSAWPSRPGWR